MGIPVEARSVLFQHFFELIHHFRQVLVKRSCQLHVLPRLHLRSHISDIIVQHGYFLESLGREIDGWECVRGTWEGEEGALREWLKFKTMHAGIA